MLVFFNDVQLIRKNKDYFPFLFFFWHISCDHKDKRDKYHPAKRREGGVMSILQQAFTTDQKKDGGLSLINRAKSPAARFSESFWFCLSFLLFIVMGPFSVIAVLIGLWSLASNDECKDNMVEPANI